MLEKNGNVKWTHAIPLLALFVTIGLFLTGGVISNDRIRASEDQRIEGKIDGVKDCFHNIDVRLARIEDRLGVQNLFTKNANK